MTIDDFILLVSSQWERGLIVPLSLPDDDPLLVTAAQVVEAGLAVSQAYHVSCGRAQCFALTKAGWLRYGELVGVEVAFIR